MKIAVTGHRPNKLWGYDLSHPKYQELKELFKTALLSDHCTEAITGMALGVDTVFALAVLELKTKGHDILLHCAIPCLNHPCKWPAASQRMYQDILSRADTVKIVTEQSYSPRLMQIRNEYMVDLADKVIAVWDGSSGGTGNCVTYAMSRQKEIIIIHPDTGNTTPSI